MNRPRRSDLPLFKRLPLLLLAVGLLGSCGRVEQPLNSFDSQGPIAERINDLFWPVFWGATVIFVLVQGALLLAVFLFRERKGKERPEPKQIAGNTRLELIWTVVPTLILAAIAVPTITTLFDLAECPAGAMEIEVIGHQWWFEFRYPDSGVVTANVMVIPEDTEVCAKMTSDDVLHNFWIPKLAGKRYLVPGQETEQRLYAEQPGEYWGHCAEFCGLSHARMRARVEAMTQADFETWTTEQLMPAATPAPGSEAERGQEIFLAGTCVGCHIIDGVNNPDPATLTVPAPDLTHFASRSVFAGATLPAQLSPTDADWEAGLRLWLTDPPTWKPGSFMPELGLTADEIDALVAYLSSLE
ncbi:MAG: cytochrome c oxidase subunit II [bacterium]|nr:cytochrome c oxidase subunit II [bacterium]MCY3652890.1 cytochrome c oxidase subunit II [bacterium]